MNDNFEYMQLDENTKIKIPKIHTINTGHIFESPIISVIDINSNQVLASIRIWENFSKLNIISFDKNLNLCDLKIQKALIFTINYFFQTNQQFQILQNNHIKNNVEENLEIIKFYENCGFEEIDTTNIGKTIISSILNSEDKQEINLKTLYCTLNLDQNYFEKFQALVSHYKYLKQKTPTTPKDINFKITSKEKNNEFTMEFSELKEILEFLQKSLQLNCNKDKEIFELYFPKHSMICERNKFYEKFPELREKLKIAINKSAFKNSQDSDLNQIESIAEIKKRKFSDSSSGYSSELSTPNSSSKTSNDDSAHKPNKILKKFHITKTERRRST